MKALGRRSVSSVLMILLNVAWFGVALGLAVTLVLLLATPFLDVSALRLTIPVSFALDARTHPVKLASASGAAAEDSGMRMGGQPGFGFEVGEDDPKNPQFHVRGSLRFPTTSRTLFAANAGIFLGFLSVVLWTLGQLRTVFRTLRDGHPFMPANAWRIRRVGYAVILIEIGRTAAVYFENSYVMTHFSAAGVRFDATPDLNLFAIVYGLIILVIAQVFATGAQLDEEQSLTI
jgi:hypothetical protein